MKKKGTVPEGLNVSILIIVIGLFILAYIVLLPPEAREELLEVEGVEEIEGESTILLSESPGFVAPLEEDTVRHKIAPVSLFLRTEPFISYISDALYLERGLFRGKSHELTFSLDRLNDLERVDIFFFARNPKGVLHVKLNGEDIYANKIASSGIISINLPLRLLREVNHVELSVSFALFGYNHYSLESVKIRREYQDVNLKEERYFVISSYEYNHLKSAELNYFMYCDTFSETGVKLKIRLNNELFRSTTIPCTSLENSFDIEISDLEEGKNSLSFEINEGDYSFNDIEVELELKEKTHPTYFFTLDEKSYESLIDEDSIAVLDLTFVDVSKLKKAQLFVNDKRIYLNTNRDTYSKDLSSSLKEGSNRLKIVPQNRFEIVTLEISLEEI